MKGKGIRLKKENSGEITKMTIKTESGVKEATDEVAVKQQGALHWE